MLDIYQILQTSSVRKCIEIIRKNLYVNDIGLI